MNSNNDKYQKDPAKKDIKFILELFNSNKLIDAKKEIEGSQPEADRRKQRNNRNELEKLKRELKKDKIIKVANLGSSKIYLFDAKKYLNTALKLLNRDQFILTKKIPNFKKNKIPFK